MNFAAGGKRRDGDRYG